MQMLEAMTATSRKLGPYVLLEVLLPGGTLIAFLLFLYRHPATVRSYATRAKHAALRAAARMRRAVAPRAARAPSLTTGIGAALRALG